MKKLLPSLALILCLAAPSLAALTFAADGDRIVTSTGPATPTAGTVMLWFYPTDDTQRQTLFHFGTSGSAEFEITWRADIAGDAFQSNRQRGSTYIFANSDAANYGVYATNKWLFIVFRFDTSGANGDQSLWMGDLATAAAAPASYSSQTVGSGTVDTTAGTFQVGNTTTNTAREFRGHIAWVGVWSRLMSNSEVRTQQWFPHVTDSCIFFMHPGFNGSGTQVDWSGNAYNGTITGSLALANHVPLGRLY